MSDSGDVEKDQPLEMTVEEDSDDEVMEEKSDKPNKSPGKKDDKLKENKKAPKEEEGEDDGSEKSEDGSGTEDEEGDEPRLGLLDLPIEVSGSRERKKVERLEVSFATPSKDKLQDIPEGHGEKLGDCPRVEFQINRVKAEDLKILHRVLYNRPGSGSEIKKNLRKFNGFTFDRDSGEYERKKANIEKQTMQNIKHMCEVLDLERGGTKEDVVTRLLDYLMEPKASGKNLQRSKKKGTTRGDKRKRTPTGEKKEKGKKKRTGSKRGGSSGEDDRDEDSYKEDSDEETDDQKRKGSEPDGEESEEEEEPEEDSEDDRQKKKNHKKKGAKPMPAKKGTKSSEKKKPVRSEEKSKTEEKKTSSRKNKRGARSDRDRSDRDSSDDEPLAKRGKSPPSDEEIKHLVKKILDGANLEEITMKKVIKQVFDEFPNFDLSEKKDFIKSTVRSIIS